MRLLIKELKGGLEDMVFGEIYEAVGDPGTAAALLVAAHTGEVESDDASMGVLPRAPFDII